MKKILALIAIILGVFLFNGCSEALDNEKVEEVNAQITKTVIFKIPNHSNFKMVYFSANGHQWIHLCYGDGTVIHDPDCPCIKHTSESDSFDSLFE